MSETKHLPWKIGRNSFQVYDTEGHHIADMHLPLLRTLDDEAVVVERARIILDSVNQHDRLMEIRQIIVNSESLNGALCERCGAKLYPPTTTVMDAHCAWHDQFGSNNGSWRMENAKEIERAKRKAINRGGGRPKKKLPVNIPQRRQLRSIY